MAVCPRRKSACSCAHAALGCNRRISRCHPQPVLAEPPDFGEEVAAIAGVSVDYCTRLEQGRARNPSEVVVDALAGTLLLGDEEREHLFRLAAHAGSPRRARTAPTPPPGPTRRMPVARHHRPVSRLRALEDQRSTCVERGRHRPPRGYRPMVAGTPQHHPLHFPPPRSQNAFRGMELDSVWRGRASAGDGGDRTERPRVGGAYRRIGDQERGISLNLAAARCPQPLHWEQTVRPPESGTDGTELRSTSPARSNGLSYTRPYPAHPTATRCNY